MMCVLRGFSPWYRPFESYTKQPAAGLLVGSCVVVVCSCSSKQEFYSTSGRSLGRNHLSIAGAGRLSNQQY